ncbi:aldose epimerase family protein [Consotaella salsifontis]|uniref:Aldose 1-epimerase n=1 Tax=Consotaella salsifontis TaxID=1365950 RepID=A0A1T4PUQ6_9HYPH|nr:aldose epimerase family protein [Consotaella salsifontis]SJZ95282.1 aldose 1-epimerase [Consotaella salsifontis]
MERRTIGELDGSAIEEVVLSTPEGARASIITIGATVRDLKVPLRDGSLRRVVLGFQDVDSYRDNPCYIGVTAGRCCNRIDGGRFTLDGKTYQLALNNNGTLHLHGGDKGFSRSNWTIAEAGDDFVTLTLTSPDGDDGYPGKVEATCRYQLKSPATLSIEMTATTDAATPINLTNHAYFNLDEGSSSHDHWLEIDAELYTPSLPSLIPTGEILKVEGTPYDFRAMRRIGGAGVGYDTNWVLGGTRGEMQEVARLSSPKRDLDLVVATDQPGILMYDGSTLLQAGEGLDGQKHVPHAALCLETQHFVNSVNTRHFPSVVLRPGETYRHRCDYRFEAK